MKRDFDLLRKLLLKIEEAPYQGVRGFPIPKIEGYTNAELQYHVWLLQEARYIMADGSMGLNELDFTWEIQSLTLRGHDFLDNARDQNRWNQAKKTISERGGSLTFDILKGVLAQLARQAVGL